MDDKSIVNFLLEIGLSKTEQSLYVAGLESSNIDVSTLIRNTGINRTTAYHALGTLKQKGLTSESKLNGVLVYKMTSPEELSTFLDVKKAKIDSQKSQLQGLLGLFPDSDQAKSGSITEKFEGIDNVKLVIEKAIYSRSREWRIVAPKNNFFSQVDPSYAKYFLKTRGEQGIRARSLWEENSKKPGYLSRNDLLTRKPRYLPKEMSGTFTSVIIVFDDKALFIAPLAQESAILITSEEIIGTLEILFDGLWLKADKPR